MLALLVACAAIWWVYVNRQYVGDYIRFSSYQPTAEIARMAVRVGLTDAGKFRTYSAEPKIDDAEDFNQHCGAAGQEVNVLGCYTNETIYVFNVKNAQIDGIKEVTLVHEMLHAAYARLSVGERTAIDKAIDEYMGAHDDKALKDHMANYPTEDRYTELHSVLGTEYTGLPSPLEEHYGKLFSRSDVVALYNSYKQKFEDIEARADAIVIEGEALARDVTEQSAAYSAALNGLEAQIRGFNDRANTSGGFGSQAEFNGERAALIAESNRLEAMRVEINQKIDRYNALVDELKQLELQSKELNDSINSKLQAVPEL